MQQTTKALLRLRELVLNGALAPGERLSELALVERLEVSRTPLRLALARLEDEGLVEALPSGGFVVRAFTETDIFDAIELRGTLEGMAARLAAERGRGEEAALRALAECLDRLDDVVPRAPQGDGALSDYMHLNERFHAGLMALAASPVLERSFEKAARLPFASPSAFLISQARLPASHRILVIAQEQHRALLEAVAGGEGARAEALAREHARIARRNLQIVLRDARAFERMPGAALVRVRETA